jgi:hypothetical protein
MRDSEDPRLQQQQQQQQNSDGNPHFNFGGGPNENASQNELQNQQQLQQQQPQQQQQKETIVNNNSGDKSHLNENGCDESTTKQGVHVNNNSSSNGGDPTQLPGLHQHEDKEAENNESKENKSSGGPKILLSGFVPSELSEVKKMCSELGAELTSQAKSATHLVMPKMGRTISFLCAINYVKFVLTVDWINDSHKEKKWKGNFTSYC